jgi:transcriptional regulator with XRE-family HTH domain
MEEFYVRLGQRIREARKSSGMTQEAAAARLSLSRTSFVNIEKGRQRLAVHQLVDLAKVLGFEPGELLNEDPVNETDFIERVLRHSETSS